MHSTTCFWLLLGRKCVRSSANTFPCNATAKSIDLRENRVSLGFDIEASAETWEYAYDTKNELVSVKKEATDGGTVQMRRPTRMIGSATASNRMCSTAAA